MASSCLLLPLQHFCGVLLNCRSSHTWMNEDSQQTYWLEAAYLKFLSMGNWGLEVYIVLLWFVVVFNFQFTWIQVFPTKTFWGKTHLTPCVCFFCFKRLVYLAKSTGMSAARNTARCGDTALETELYTNLGLQPGQICYAAVGCLCILYNRPSQSS